MPLQTVIARIACVSEEEKETMFRLHSRYYCGSERATFFRDFNEKDWVIVLRDEAGQIAGFSTLQLIPMEIDGTRRRLIFSGDTIVAPDHWRSSTLAGAFGHFMLRALREYPDETAHWFLISKGYRTYRFLPVFFKHYHPACGIKTPPEIARLISAAATAKFGIGYHAAAGVIRCAGAKDRLCPDLCDIPAHRLRDPHVAFFLERNPGWQQGEELVCLADVAPGNFNASAWRVIQHVSLQWHE